MFLHIFLYRLKCIIRDRETLFWTLLFPILLAILFNMSLGNIANSEVFSEIKIAVVDNAEYKENINFQKVLSSVSKSHDNIDETVLFDVTYTSKSDADRLLEDNKIYGYIHFDNGMKLNVKKSGLNQTIIKAFLDDYNQTSSTVLTIISNNPEAQQDLINDISDRKNYLKEVPASKSSPDTVVNYFYTLIAMACLYGSFWGLKEVMDIQGNLSSKGARINLAPTHKLKVFTVSILAAAVVQIFIILILLSFLIFILKIDFGNQIGYVLLTSVAGTLTGVTFGAFIAAIFKTGEGIKTAILVTSSMVMSFLAGMMYSNIKLIITENIPILGYLNPANLIADSLYSLYYYNTHSQLYTNLSLLCCFIVFFSLITYFVLRRQKYASI